MEDKDKISITQKCYIKSGHLFFPQSRTMCSIIPEEVSINDFRLVDTTNVLPQVLIQRTNETNILAPYPIKEITPQSSIYVLCVRKRKMELDAIETKKRKIEYLENTV